MSLSFGNIAGSSFGQTFIFSKLDGRFYELLGSPAISVDIP
jgi:hypothetical protein